MNSNPGRAGKWALIIAAIAIQFAARTSAAPVEETITFDGFSLGTDSISVPSGYGGLQWNNFGIYRGTDRPVTEGYWTGVVSPDDVAFNEYGDPASISCATPFDLKSAYLTSQIYTNQPLEVQGFTGTNLTYDNTYTTGPDGPTLINFNYLGVTLVKFIPPADHWFIMDNLEAIVDTTNPVTPPPGPVYLGNEQVGSIEGAFVVIPVPAPPSVHAVRDYLIDQRGGPGELTRVTANFDTNNQFSLTISAPPGQQFWAHIPPGQSVRFGGNLTWQAVDPLPNGPLHSGSVAVSFGGLQGAAPDFSASHSAISQSQGYFGFNDIQSTMFSNDIAFTSVTFTAMVPATNVGAGSLVYMPVTNGGLYLYYYTIQTNNPGLFLSIIPNVSLAPVGLVDIGNITAPSIGHEFFAQRLFSPGLQNQVNDFLVDQDGSSGGGAMTPAFSADFDTNNEFTMTVSAPPGQKFLVNVPAGQAASFYASLDWQGSAQNGPSYYGIVSAAFGGLEGTPPDFSGSIGTLSQFHGFMGFNNVASSSFSNALAFTSITLTAIVPATNIAAGTISYEPESDNALTVLYFTTATNDPGQFVTLVPVAQPLPGYVPTPPAINLTVQPNGDVLVGFMNGTLQSLSDPQGTFANVPGNPPGVYTVPKSNQASQQFFRVVSHN